MNDSRIKEIVLECIGQFLEEQVISEDSAECVKWNGKYYAYYDEGVDCVVFFVLNNGSVICGDGRYRQTHEELIIRYCYSLLDKEPPINPDTQRLDFNTACREIEIGHSDLFERVYDHIVLQGRVFKTDDSKYVFSCYEVLDNVLARNMMQRVARTLHLPYEKCYYVGNYDKLVVSLTEQ